MKQQIPSVSSGGMRTRLAMLPPCHLPATRPARTRVLTVLHGHAGPGRMEPRKRWETPCAVHSRLVSRAARSGPTPGAADGLYRESAAGSESHGRGHDRQATEGGHVCASTRRGHRRCAPACAQRWLTAGVSRAARILLEFDRIRSWIERKRFDCLLCLPCPTLYMSLKWMTRTSPVKHPSCLAASRARVQAELRFCGRLTGTRRHSSRKTMRMGSGEMTRMP